MISIIEGHLGRFVLVSCTLMRDIDMCDIDMFKQRHDEHSQIKQIGGTGRNLYINSKPS